MATGQARNAHNVHIVLHRLSRHFIGSLKQGSDIDVKAEVCKTRGNYFSPAIVPILTHLGNEDSWTPTLFLGYTVREFAHLIQNGRVFHLA